jgi:hypothetical protein
MAYPKFTRKPFLACGAAGLGALAAPRIARGQDLGGRRPNILSICMDQLCSWEDFPERLSLNEKVNALIEREVGDDAGLIYPDPADVYSLKA